MELHCEYADGTSVTFTIDDACPTPRAAELSRRRFEPASETAPTRTKPQQPVAQVETWGKR